MSYPPAFWVPRAGSLADHLLCPSNPTHYHIEIIFQAEEYNGGPFLAYPDRQGWTERDHEDPRSRGKTGQEINTFFQTWLIVGLLSDTLRRPLDHETFLAKNRLGKYVLTTRAIPKPFDMWYKRDQKLLAQTQRQHCRRIDANLGTLLNGIRTWGMRYHALLGGWFLIYLMMLDRYFDTIYTAIYTNAWVFDPYDPFASTAVANWFGKNRRWGRDRRNILKARALASGWCPADISRLAVAAQPQDLYYLSRHQAPTYEVSEVKALGSMVNSRRVFIVDPFTGQCSILSKRHLACTDLHCFADDYAESKYNTKHTSRPCDCPHIQLKTNDVTKILSTWPKFQLFVSRTVVLPSYPLALVHLTSLSRTHGQTDLATLSPIRFQNANWSA